MRPNTRAPPPPSEKLMDVLLAEVIRKDYDNPDSIDFPYHPNTWQEVASHYKGRIGFLSQEQWERVYWAIHDWNEATLSQAPAILDDITLEGAFTEALLKLRHPPTFDQVASRLGLAAAERYLVDREQIESHPWLSQEELDGTPPPGGERRRIADLVPLFSVVNQPTRSAALQAFKEHRAHVQVRRRKNRTRLRETNTPIIVRARSLGIWFPYKRDHPEWSHDPRTKDRSPYFLSLVRVVRDVMAKERCILQYMPKRKLTKKTVADLDRNMTAMQRYLVSRGVQPPIAATKSSSSVSSISSISSISSSWSEGT